MEDDEVCVCGLPDYERCAECDACECPDNPGVCDGPGCMSVAEDEQMREERG